MTAASFQGMDRPPLGILSTRNKTLGPLQAVGILRGGIQVVPKEFAYLVCVQPVVQELAVFHPDPAHFGFEVAVEFPRLDEAPVEVRFEFLQMVVQVQASRAQVGDCLVHGRAPFLLV